jgi:hypothetical protein
MMNPPTIAPAIAPVALELGPFLAVLHIVLDLIEWNRTS